MTIVLQSYKTRNDRNTATVWVEQYQDKESLVPFWGIYYQYDGTPAAITYRQMLKNKPRWSVVKKLCAEL